MNRGDDLDNDALKLDPFAPSDPSSMGVYYTPQCDRYTDTARYLMEDNEITCVLSELPTQNSYMFCLVLMFLIGIELRHLRVKGFGKMGKEEDTFDIFARNDLSLCRSYPAALFIKDLTVVKVALK